MTIIAYGLLGLLLTVVRSTLSLNLGDASGQVFDLNIPLIVALGISGFVKYRLPAVFLIGFWADCLSVAPFGFYIILYGWFFMGIRGLRMFIQLHRQLTLLFVIITGVSLEYLSGFLFVRNFSDMVQAEVLFWQLLWTIFIGPLLVMIAQYWNKQLELLAKKMMPAE